MIDATEHVSQDEVAAWDLDGLTDHSRARVGEHLASGCRQCTERLRWVRRVSVTARADGLQAPPAPVLQRAVALFRRPPGHLRAG